MSAFPIIQDITPQFAEQPTATQLQWPTIHQPIVSPIPDDDPVGVECAFIYLILNARPEN